MLQSWTVIDREPAITTKEFRALLVGAERENEMTINTLSHGLSAMYMQGSSSSSMHSMFNNGAYSSNFADVDSSCTGGRVMGTPVLRYSTIHSLRVTPNLIFLSLQLVVLVLWVTSLLLMTMVQDQWMHLNIFLNKDRIMEASKEEMEVINQPIRVKVRTLTKQAMDGLVILILEQMQPECQIC